jgi:ppGpp synthetase/RelA/SpoT-type nucleotidyltranferase
LKICAMAIAEVDEEMQEIKREIERLRPDSMP